MRPSCLTRMTKTPLENFEKLRQVVLSSRDLQRELMDIERVDRFIEVAKKLAADHGITLSDDELREAMRIARKTWSDRWI